jgi:putative nucleotidyltransferase with HDIG domain
LAYAAVLALLAECVERQDPYTRDHCEQVSQYARLAAERLALTDDEKHIAACAALLHDVGKIGVRQSVLNKPGALTPHERAHVESHVQIGYDMLREIPALQSVAEAVLYHHERFDGTGYPHGLAGEQIPVASRIVAVVDSYCAMLDRRSYKEAYSPSRARAELLRCAGTQFDPVIVRAVLAAIREIDNPAPADLARHSSAGSIRLQEILIEEMLHDLGPT